MSETPLEAYAKTGVLPGEESWPAPLYWLWLAELLGAANLHAGRVLDKYGTAQAAWEARDTAEFAALAGRGAMQRQRENGWTPGSFALRAARCETCGIAVLTFEDPDYPLALSRIPDPPLVLYVTGSPAVLNGGKTVGIVGARKPTQYGAAAAASLGAALARSGAVIVSGLADGLDSEGHKAAVAANAPTIGVQGVPIDETYPAANAHLRRQIEAGGGAVVSEYPPGASIDRKVSFLQRNRIIAALSLVLLVVEARQKSGTMSTVAHAERYGKPIFAVPGSIFSPLSEGTNGLLREGRARAALDASGILGALGLREAKPAAPAAEKKPLSASARRVLACIGARPVGMDILCEQTGLPTGTLLGALTSLEMEEYILSLPGRQYVLK